MRREPKEETNDCRGAGREIDIGGEDKTTTEDGGMSDDEKDKSA